MARRHAGTEAGRYTELQRRLHDTVLQLLDYMTTEGYGTLQSPEEYRQLAARAGQELREVINGGAVRHRGELSEQLQAICDDVRTRAPMVQVELDVADDIADTEPAMADAIVACAREACNNVIKHAGASRAVIRCCRPVSGGVALSVRDNGRGICEADAARGSGLQLSIVARARAAGGTATISGAPGLGTTVRVWVPDCPWKHWGETAGVTPRARAAWRPRATPA